MEFNKNAWIDTESLYHLINLLPKPQFGIMIGVLHGVALLDLLNVIPELRVWGIDPFKVYGDIGPALANYQKQEYWDQMHDNIQRGLDTTGRGKLIRDFSQNVAHRFNDENYDWLYVDGEHSYPQVTMDIEMYEPKVRKGGIVAGHDYGLGGDGRTTKAVKDYAEKHGRDLFVNPKNYNWFWIKR